MDNLIDLMGIESDSEIFILCSPKTKIIHTVTIFPLMGHMAIRYVEFSSGGYKI